MQVNGKYVIKCLYLSLDNFCMLSKTFPCTIIIKKCIMTWFESACCMLLPHAESYGYTALVLSHFVGQWECQTLANQSFVMMHLLGEAMDINIMCMEISDHYSDFAVSKISISGLLGLLLALSLENQKGQVFMSTELWTD